MAKTIIDLSGIGGLAPKFYKNRPNLAIIGNPSSYAQGIADPISRLGYLSPACDTVTDITYSEGTVSGEIGSVQMDIDNGKEYFLERDANLYQLDGLDDTTLTLTRTITTTGAIGTDLEIYEINGVRKLFYAYKTSTAGDIGIWDFSTTFDDTWLSGTATGGSATGNNNLIMIPADNGYMYVLDGATVHKIDGTTDGGADGTATMNVLVFPAFFQLVDGIDLRGNLWIVLFKSSRDLLDGIRNERVIETQCGVYVWDRQSTQVDMVDYIPISGVREIRNIFSFRGIPACFTVSADYHTQLRMYNGNEFRVKKQLGPEAYPRFKDSLQGLGESIIWQGNDGKIYYYGRISPENEDALYEIGDVTTHIAASSLFYNGGTILIGGGDSNSEEYFLSFRDSVAYETKKWIAHPVSGVNYPHTGPIYSLVKALPKLSTVKSITLFYPPLSISTANEVMDVSVYLNQSTTAAKTVTLTRADGARGYQYIPMNKENVNFIQLGISYKSSNVLTYAITPSYAEIEYETAKNKKRQF